MPSSAASFCGERSTIDSSFSAQTMWEDAHNFQQMHSRLQHLSELQKQEEQQQRKHGNSGSSQDSSRPPSLLQTARLSLSTSSVAKKSSKDKAKEVSQESSEPEKTVDIVRLVAEVPSLLNASRASEKARSSSSYMVEKSVAKPSRLEICHENQKFTPSQRLPEHTSDSSPSTTTVDFGIDDEEEATEEHKGPRTTLMLRNLPNEYSREMLLTLLDAEGYYGKYDFVYLPIDFTSKHNFGYAFVNLVTQTHAEAFKNHFQGFSRWSMASTKAADVTWSSTHQGLAEHINRYRNSPVMHDTMPDECKPVIFSNGIRAEFPPATKTMKPPRIRPSKSRSLRGVLQEDRICIFGVEESQDSESFMAKVRKNIAAADK
eukprot:gnl/TRDRNA2_/TRDRNA2_75161_c1_seq1.p1 gnl/TRDRNA2_/TRDRNA2_75161_c1~~gnl/TRDRNA2_/TRDRNA2_75161_c1_seq1.p1  ORF type:complete len:395 (-),score=101.41 gnl/TRDRNA2_/TRDRNA2_75161_c1_seq1:140-1261(-)